MEMQQVIYFRALCVELNFTRAARRCRVSQPSLTRSIRLLEVELGGALFHREHNYTHLSELGHVVKPHLDQIFDQAEAVNESARGFQNMSRLRLKLGVMCTVAPSDLVQLLASIRTRHPGIQFEVIDATAEQLDRQLREGDLEAAILAAPDNAREPHLHYLPLFREQDRRGRDIAGLALADRSALCADG